MTDHVIAGVFLACLAGGVLPWINAELVVAGAAAVAGPTQLPGVVLAASLGHMIGKGGLYALARWAPQRLPEKARSRLATSRSLADGRRAATVAVLSSATVGLPPFYLVTLAAGVLRVPAVLFAGAGLAGLALRYTAVVWAASAAAGGVKPPFL